MRAAASAIVTRGAPWQGPLFSIILPCHLPAHPQREAIVQWLRRQTYQSFELVLWDAETGMACALDAPDQPWKVARPGIKPLQEQLPKLVVNR